MNILNIDEMLLNKLIKDTADGKCQWDLEMGFYSTLSDELNICLGVSENTLGNKIIIVSAYSEKRKEESELTVHPHNLLWNKLTQLMVAAKEVAKIGPLGEKTIYETLGNLGV